MSSIIKAIEKAFFIKEKRNWDTIYWAIDIHDTIVKSNYEVGNIPKDYYENAVEVLQLLTNRKDIKLILYTCSHPHEVEKYHEFFAENNIKFDFVNQNPNVLTDLQGYGNYEDKPYFNVLLDDKAGFNPDEDWKLIIEYFKNKKDE